MPPPGTNGSQPYVNPAVARLVTDLETPALSPSVAAVIKPIEPPHPEDPLTRPLGMSGFAPMTERGLPPVVERIPQASIPSSPALAKNFGQISKMVPGAERIRLRKREATGHMATIGEWSIRDIQTAGDLESFLLQYVVPQWKGGDYYVAIFNSKGVEYDGGVITMASMPAGAPNTIAGGNNDLAFRMLDKMERMERNMMQPAPPPQDPMETFAKVRKQIDELKANGLGGDAAMMMAMMQSQQRQGPDPYMIEQMATMRAELASLKNVAAAPLPPPPPAPAEMPPWASALLAAFTPVLAAAAQKMIAPPEDPNRMSVKELLPYLTQKPDPDRLSTRDIIDLFREARGEAKNESISDKLREVAAMKELASELVGGGGNSQTTSFWDALAALASNKDFAGNLGKMLGTEMDRRRLPANTGPQVQVVRQPAASTPAQVVQQTPQPGQAIQTSDAPRIFIPDDMRDFCAKMEGADTDQSRIIATIETLNRLRPTRQWKAFVEELLAQAAANDKEKTITSLKGWLGLLVANRLLDRAAGFRVIASFESNWDAIHATIVGLRGAAQQQAVQPPSSPIVPPPTPQAPPAAPTPEPEPEPEDEDGEDEGSDEEDEGDAA